MKSFGDGAEGFRLATDSSGDGASGAMEPYMEHFEAASIGKPAGFPSLPRLVAGDPPLLSTPDRRPADRFPAPEARTTAMEGEAIDEIRHSFV